MPFGPSITKNFLVISLVKKRASFLFDNSNFKSYSYLMECNQGFEIIWSSLCHLKVFYIQCPVFLSAIAVPVALSLLGPY